REEAIEFVNNPGYSIRWVVGPEGKGIFTSEEDMMSYLKTDELLGISLKDKTVEQYIEENKQNYQNIPLIAAMGMGVVQSTATPMPTPEPTVTSTVTATPTLTPTPMIEDETPSLITLEQPYKDSLEVNMPEENNFVQNNSGYFIKADDLTRNNVKDFNDIFYNKFELPIEERISLLKNQKNDLIIQEVELGTISASISGPNSSQQPIATPTIQGEEIVNDSSDTLSIRNKIERLELAINQQEALLKETRDLNRNGGWFGKDGDIRLLAVKRDKTSDPTKISYYNEQIEKVVESFNSRISSQEFIPVDDLLNSNNI
ncbi:MAG: hypothetical protein PHR09_00650, partial [Bacilli bacterium]|nr:hypothetical protein [Bacilli bacterium]